MSEKQSPPAAAPPNSADATKAKPKRGWVSATVRSVTGFGVLRSAGSRAARDIGDSVGGARGTISLLLDRLRKSVTAWREIRKARLEGRDVFSAVIDTNSRDIVLLRANDERLRLVLRNLRAAIAFNFVIMMAGLGLLSTAGLIIAGGSIFNALNYILSGGAMALIGWIRIASSAVDYGAITQTSDAPTHLLRAMLDIKSWLPYEPAQISFVGVALTLVAGMCAFALTLQV